MPKAKNNAKETSGNEIRINRFLAMCGLGSRRKVEELVNTGKVYINGRRIESLSTVVDPSNDTVKCQGKIVAPHAKNKYIIFNKPKGCITTVSDPEGRPTVMNFIPLKLKREGVFPVGRLDKDTEGLLILTNDGELSNRLMHPKFNSSKEYLVTLDKPLEEHHRKKIMAGVHFREFHARPCEISYADPDGMLIRMTISEGKKRQIRITFKKFQYKVKKLKRLSVGPLTLGCLRTGMTRELKRSEIANLMEYAGM